MNLTTNLFLAYVNETPGRIHSVGITQQLLNVEFPEIPLASGGLHHGKIVDLDLVTRLGVGGVQFTALSI